MDTPDEQPSPPPATPPVSEAAIEAVAANPVALGGFALFEAIAARFRRGRGSGEPR